MINTELTARIACSFIAGYYHGFANDLPGLVRFYGESSSASFARVGEAVATTSQGKVEVLQHLERLNAELGPRKVEVRTADFVPTADGSVAITVSGQVFTKKLRQTFTQTFVLSPTKFRENTMFISADSLRFVSSEREVIPVNAIVVGPGEELNLSVVTANKSDTAVSERKERPPRKERKPRIEKTAAEPVPEAAAKVEKDAAPQDQQVRKERKPREQKTKTETPVPVAIQSQSADVKDKRKREKEEPKQDPSPAQAGSAQKSWAGLVSGKPQVEQLKATEKNEKTDKPIKNERKKRDAPAAETEVSSSKEVPPVRERTLTSKVKLLKVPKPIRLSEVRGTAENYGTVRDAFWCGDGDEDAVVELSTPEEARALQFDRAFSINGIKIRRVFYF